ncbi:MAG: C10 family peptidase [Bacteroidales bacterium]|nr:C10 family peptidase [Bacteroidales bacterium]
MKSRSWYLITTSLFILSLNSPAQVVEPFDARKIALITLSELHKGSAAGTITGDSVIYNSLKQPLLYFFTESKGGFIILSADKRTYPLLGWGDSGSSFPGDQGLPPAYIELIDNWKAQIEYCRLKNLTPTNEISDTWTTLENGEVSGLSGTKDVLPLLATKWSQGCGYNTFCPVDASGPCGHAVTGCVATAMAQVIRFMEHPVSGTGSKCYTSYRYGELCADFSSAIYNYAAMSNTSGNTEVAKLIYHCGVSVSMNYGPSASSASSGSVASAMRTYFDYTNGLILSKSAYPEANWASLLKSELDSSRPLYYSGYGTVGHAFVLDGYQDENYFHVNWGWGGSYNGYFYLSSLNPGSMSFTSGQQAIVGMVPTAEFTGINFTSAIELGCKTPVSASLADGLSVVNYYKNLYPATPGKELVYRFTTSLTGRITVRITDQTSSVYTFLLNYANKDSVLAYGLNGIVAENTSPGTYYIVVESNDFSEPEFTIEATCPTMEADLDIVSATVTPQFIESLQTNVRCSATIRNIGKTSAPASELEYFLSADNKLDPVTDRYIGKVTVSPLAPDQRTSPSSVLTMPDSLLPGSYFVILAADRGNIVPEADDRNLYFVPVTVPDTGLLDCSGSKVLYDGVWYYGNTLSDGSNLVEEYAVAQEMTGPEVVHAFTPSYNGIVKLSFVDKSPGILYAMILPVCNENTGNQPLRLHNLTDTLASDEFYAVAGIHYYIVVDGYKGASGVYGLKVELPGECPEAVIEYSGKTDLCDGEPWPYLRVPVDHSTYQWLRDGIKIPEATSCYYNVRSEGSYTVEITENGCKTVSSPLIIRSDPRPDTANISSSGPAVFCPGGSILLKLDKSVNYPFNWAVDDILVPSATGTSFYAGHTGTWSLYTINGACKVRSSNTIDVTVLQPPADLNDTIPFPSDKIRFFEPFNTGGSYEGGTITQKTRMICWDYEPVDDRFGNFWKARYLTGVDEYMYWNEYDTLSEDVTIAMWFRTTTTDGGVLAGFYDSPYSPSKSEALLYMSDNGKLHFRLSNAGSPKELSTVSSYNDGKWHYVVMSHDGGMTLETDDGAEKISSSGPYSMELFTGTWTFGGTYLPAGVSDRPQSLFFKGALDDILCLEEENRYTTAYMFRQPLLKVNFSEALPECIPATVSFSMLFGEKGVQYRIWDRLRELWAPVSAISDGGPVQFGDAELVMGRNEFQVVATNLSTGCETVLDTILVAEVDSYCTTLTENQETTGLKVYPVPAGEILYFESERLMKEIRIYDSAGKILHFSAPLSNKAAIPVGKLLSSVYSYQVCTIDNIVLGGRFLVAR